MSLQLTHHASLMTHHRRQALGMVEAVVSTLIVGVLLVSALNTVAASRTGLHKIGERGRGAMLAQQFMSEILQCAYEDPEDGALQFGPGLSEWDGSRLGFDDVDDYHGWSETPPQLRDGTEIANFDGWERCVTVDFVNPGNLTTTSAYNTGVKRIVVTVKNQGRTAAVWTAVRASAGAVQIIEDPVEYVF